MVQPGPALNNGFQRHLDRDIRRIGHVLHPGLGIIGPVHRIAQDGLHISVVIGGIGFVAGPEVEHIARTPFVGQARPEHLAALKPADKHGFQRIGHAERLAIHFLLLQLEMLGQAPGNRVVPGRDPQTFPLARLAPGQVARGAHDLFENLGKMRRMQQDQTHAGPDRLGHTFDHGILDLAMGGMPPPDQHVRFGQTGSRQAMFGFLQSGRGGRNPLVGVQRIGNALVHPLGVNVCDDLVCLFVDVFAPDHCADDHAFPPDMRPDVIVRGPTGDVSLMLALTGQYQPAKTPAIPSQISLNETSRIKP